MNISYKSMVKNRGLTICLIHNDVSPVANLLTLFIILTSRNECMAHLKGQCHKIFCFRFFSWITFPQAFDNNSRIISNFFENSRRYSQAKVHHRCQRHWWQICYRCQWHRWQIAAGINDTGGKFATGFFQRHRRQVLPQIPVDTGGK